MPGDLSGGHPRGIPMLLKSLRIAFNFLTTFPIAYPADSGEKEYGNAAAFYPFVGLVIGLLAAGFSWLCGKIFPPSITAVLTVGLWVILTGGLHLDGLSDCCDGFFYAGAPEKRLQIMKDPHHGTYAVLGVCLTLILKTFAVMELAANGELLAFPLAAVLGRFGILVLLRQPLANPNGMAAALKQAVPGSALWIGSLIPVLLALLSLPTGLPMLAAAGILYFLIGRLASCRINGINGDVLGMTVELTEVIVLLIPNLLFFGK